MNSMTEPTNNVDQINDTIVTAAIKALAIFEPAEPEQAVDMLRFWVRRAEMTEVDLAEVQNRMFPIVEDELAEPPACPPWCTGAHLAEHQGVPEVRQCESEEMFVPMLKNGVAGVNIERIFDRITGRYTRYDNVRLEDFEFTPQYARHLARLLVRAADLIDG
jgi:hypothetical protein